MDRVYATLLLAVICLFPQASGQDRPAPAQASAPPATVFPEKLLEGNPQFDLALLFQGDIRGNFGPCG